MTVSLVNASLRWDAVAGSKSYQVKRNGTVVTSTKTALTVKTMTLASGDEIDVVAQPSGTVQSAVITLAPVVTPPPPPPPPSGNGDPHGRWFPDSAWCNTPLPANPAIDPNSAKWINQIVAACPKGLYFNGVAAGGAWSVAVYHANASTPTARVTLDFAYPGTGNPWIDVPYQQGWQPTPDSDAHLAVIRDDTGWQGEFQGFTINGPGSYHAHSFAQYNVINANPLPTDINRVADLPLLAGLVTPYDISQGVIRHAIRAALPIGGTNQDHNQNPATGWRYPANQSDGWTNGGPPMGAQTFLDASASLSGLSPFLGMVGVALKSYGMFFGDSNEGQSLSGNVEAVCDGSTYGISIDTLPVSFLAKMHVRALPS
jgi:hypothetical protein